VEVKNQGQGEKKEGVPVERFVSKKAEKFACQFAGKGKKVDQEALKEHFQRGGGRSGAGGGRKKELLREKENTERHITFSHQVQAHQGDHRGQGGGGVTAK